MKSVPHFCTGAATDRIPTTGCQNSADHPARGPRLDLMGKVDQSIARLGSEACPALRVGALMGLGLAALY